MLTPAEKLSAKKPVRRTPRNRAYLRKNVFDCSIRDLRESLRLSMRDVCGSIGISVTALHQIEHGTDPMLTTAMKLAAFFGTPVEELWKTK